jgi:hypothetical protein
VALEERRRGGAIAGAAREREPQIGGVRAQRVDAARLLGDPREVRGERGAIGGEARLGRKDNV